jgi:hypothetical protein
VFLFKILSTDFELLRYTSEISSEGDTYYAKMETLVNSIEMFEKACIHAGEKKPYHLICLKEKTIFL